MSSKACTVSDFDLFIVNGFLDQKTCRDLIDEMRSAPVIKAATYGKGEPTVDERVRRANRMFPGAETILLISRRLEEQRSLLERHFDIGLSGCEEPQFLRYRAGDFFVAHQDGNTGLVNLESDRTRRVSVTIFLNDQLAEARSDSYCGGSLVFSDWRTGTRQEITGEAGMLLAFRSELTHEVQPVTQGERYAIVSWYRR